MPGSRRFTLPAANLPYKGLWVLDGQIEFGAKAFVLFGQDFPSAIISRHWADPRKGEEEKGLKPFDGRLNTPIAIDGFIIAACGLTPLTWTTTKMMVGDVSSVMEERVAGQVCVMAEPHSQGLARVRTTQVT
jgi:hypothetical protein